MKDNKINLLNILIIFVLLCIPLSLISINSELIIGDELWNFQNISKLINGATMYVNCNIIVTPIFYLIGYCFVKYITGTILGFRIYNIIILFSLLLSCFVLFKTLKINITRSFLYTLIVFLFVMPYVNVGANYNVLAETIYIIGIILFFNKDRFKFYNFYQGLVIFSCVFTKQNIGLYYLIGLIIIEIIIDKKESIHYIIKEIMFFLCLTLIAVLIMFNTGCYSGFLNYTIFGMREFTIENTSIEQSIEVIIIGYLIIALCSYILGFFISRKIKNISNNIVVLSIFSIFLNFSIFPIFNLYHASFAILLNLIIFIFFLEKLLICNIKNNIILNVIILLLYITINSYGIICVYKSCKNFRIVDKESIYYSSNISLNLYKQLEDVTDYIKQKEEEGIGIICITADGPLYMTYLKKNNGDFDLCFNGNLGYNGKKNIINKIQTLENTQILMNKNIYWQEVDELRFFVIENFKKVGNINDLMIYESI
ncbi:MAG: hypothetical protein IKM97_05640 [Clostridia bacterium]|nr:hypothetical protein [Clostridia bacterium]